MTGKTPKKKERPGVDRLGRSTLHYAAADKNGIEVTKLLQEGSDPNALDDNNWTPLHFASQANSLPIAQALLAAGADINARDSFGNTPLFRAIMNSKGDRALVIFLKQAGANPNIKNDHGVSPLKLVHTILADDLMKIFSDVPFADA